jgi:hypothetical protein
MENNSDDPSDVSSPAFAHTPSDVSADDARAQLGALALDRAALADRLVTPAWYHPVLAALVFVFVAGAASERWWIVSFTVYCAGLVWLTTTYRKITGMWANGWTRLGGRGLAAGLFALLLAAIAVSYAVRFDRLAWWWALVSAAVAALGTLWIGPRFDAACRAALRDPR